MRTDEIADSLEVASLTVQLAVGAAVEELRALPADDPRRDALKLALTTAYGRMRGTYGAFVTESREYTFFDEAGPVTAEMFEAAKIMHADSIALQSVPNVVTLPVVQKTRWTVIKTLDGAHWASSHDFGISGAWGWIVDAVAAEHGISDADAEDRIGSREGIEGVYDGDDVVTVDGHVVYRIEHTSTPFSK